mmetsp:Transcript_98224/g.276209  ORF Transcript_98224/g.276209 Transcript_98224/m.276209 type:complete len:337 (+) Transcript_98224:80-1090(+)
MFRHQLQRARLLPSSDNRVVRQADQNLVVRCDIGADGPNLGGETLRRDVPESREIRSSLDGHIQRMRRPSQGQRVRIFAAAVAARQQGKVHVGIGAFVDQGIRQCTASMRTDHCNLGGPEPLALEDGPQPPRIAQVEMLARHCGRAAAGAGPLLRLAAASRQISWVHQSSSIGQPDISQVGKARWRIQVDHERALGFTSCDKSQRNSPVAATSIDDEPPRAEHLADLFEKGERLLNLFRSGTWASACLPRSPQERYDVAAVRSGFLPLLRGRQRSTLNVRGISNEIRADVSSCRAASASTMLAAPSSAETRRSEACGCHKCGTAPSPSRQMHRLSP